LAATPPEAKPPLFQLSSGKPEAFRTESGKAANQLPRGRSRKQLLGDAKTFCETEKR